MYQGKYVFTQLTDVVPKHSFKACVDRYKGDYRIKSFTCWQQFLCLVFGQITFRESLRDIVICLSTQQNKLYHLGFRTQVARSTLSEANRSRDWRIYRDFAQLLIHKTRQAYATKEVTQDAFSGFDFPIYAMDSTLIRLCVTVFSWARYRTTTAGIKLHTLLDVQHAVPQFIRVTHGRVNDNQILKELPIEANALYVMDRGYWDLPQLYRIHRSDAFYVIRVRKDLNFTMQSSNPVDPRSSIVFDQIGKYTHWSSRNVYPDRLRCIKVLDSESQKTLLLLTNHFDLQAHQVAQIYRQRWQIELFFKWIKQHLKIKVYWGENENAVKTQLYSAIATYLMVALLKKRHTTTLNMYQILQILSISALTKTPVNQLLTQTTSHELYGQNHNQLNIWDL